MYSQLHLLFAILLSVIVTVAIVITLSQRKHKSIELKIQEKNSEINEHQKFVHRLEAEHLRSKNSLEIEHYEITKKIKDQHYSEGYDHGLAASQKDHLIETTNIKSLHRDELIKREAESELKGRAIAKMEHEAQVKAFSVEIRPYVRVEKDSGVFRKDSKSYTGYQYQLLVNGIPAFQPHVVIEYTEEFKEVDKQTLSDLLKLAHKAANIAATTYLGGSPSGALKIGQEIVQQLKM